MKKVLLVFAAVILFIGGSGYSWYISNYQGANYYVFISEDCEPTEKEVKHKGRKTTQYTYLLKGYNEKGESQELELKTFYKLIPNTYLEAFSNKNKKVTSWVERSRDEIPRQPWEQLE
ncbi:YxeA family protein [Lactococcus garvieae]|uniref:YxeA family protein n=1 Tax=Lactococcus garvieae TaxID=1363 RepID=UPI0009C000B2|nr:YxeA family protein [Lactococcus garvieae]